MIVLHVVPTTFEREKVSQIDPASVDAERRFAEDVVARGVEILHGSGVAARGLVLEGAPSQVILEQIDALAPASVVMGSRGLQDVMPEGSVSRRVRAGTTVPVEVVE